MIQRAVFIAMSAFPLTVATTAWGQEISINYSLFGTPGLLDMPSAHTAPEGALATTLSYQDGLIRAAATFQLTNRLSASARYSIVDLYDATAADIDRDEFERSYDLHYRLNNEGTYLPAFAIGIRDMFTPGRFSSEYIVATKSIGDKLTVTGGIGWGAMGTRDSFDNPFSGLDDRPVFDPDDSDGQLGSDYWFRGDAATFGGLTYQINDRWGVVAEYSSIAYPETGGSPALEGAEPYNLGVIYRPGPGTQLTLASLYGSEIALSGTFTLNANNRPSMSGFEKAPAPIKARSPAERREQVWNRAALPEAGLRAALTALLDIEGLTLTGLDVTDTTARVRYTNSRYRSDAQAMGRVARMMTQIMPGSVQTFILEPESRGIPLSATTIARSDLEDLENRPGAADTLFQRAAFNDAASAAPITPTQTDPVKFSWGLGPYFSINPFGSDGSIAVDAGLSLRGRYEFTPQLVASGTIAQSIIKADAEDPSRTTNDAGIPKVRTNGSFYGDDGIPVLQNLTLAYFGRPGQNLYSRATVGYLERMYGGLSTELLWKPVDSRFGLGAELNYVAQRNTDMAFGFDEFDYDVLTGHLSAYYDLGNGYHTQLDVGRYLAEDWGATLSVDREYENGVRIGAYVTQTEISYADFEGGSYNKGVRIAIPQDFFTGSPTRRTRGTTIRTRSGDGGARLNVDGRLYGIVRDAHKSDLEDTWGRFWR